MRVFLIHGMGRTPASMAWLALRLRWAGHQTRLFGYSVTLESLDQIAERFLAHVCQTLEQDRAEAGESETDPIPYAVVGHSLGNIITRMNLGQLPAGLQRFVMLAPPNNSPALARELQDNPVYQALTSDTGQRLCDEDFFESLEIPAMPTLILAGTKGPSGVWHPLGYRANDAVVAVDETRLGNIEVIEVPGVHSFLMNRGDVFEHVQRFLSP